VSNPVPGLAVRATGKDKRKRRYKILMLRATRYGKRTPLPFVLYKVSQKDSEVPA
jgi:hypothetical protein